MDGGRFRPSGSQQGRPKAGGTTTVPNQFARRKAATTFSSHTHQTCSQSLQPSSLSPSLVRHSDMCISKTADSPGTVADRISVISAPSKITPSILSAVRNAITSSSNPHSRQSTSASGATANTAATTATSEKSAVTWSTRPVKLEGWVHPGVYRFWVGGMRRWVVGGVRKKVIDK